MKLRRCPPRLGDHERLGKVFTAPLQGVYQLSWKCILGVHAFSDGIRIAKGKAVELMRVPVNGLLRWIVRGHVRIRSTRRDESQYGDCSDQADPRAHCLFCTLGTV